MKRDLNLIRLILLAVEKFEESTGSESIAIDGRNGNEVAYHVGLLTDAGYLDATTLRAGGGGMFGEYPVYMIRGMTFRGHDYLDAVRKASVWQKVKDSALKHGVSLTLDIAKELAMAEVRNLMGM